MKEVKEMNEMTDNEIIKAWKCCRGQTCNCKECPMEGVNSCWIVLKHKTLDLITRQKAEIERLQKEFDIMRFTTAKRWVKEAKSEAYKELAERLKEKFHTAMTFSFVFVRDSIDNLLAEMERESNVYNNKAD